MHVPMGPGSGRAMYDETMRTLRLGRTFDAVLAHDAVMSIGGRAPECDAGTGVR